MTRIAIVIFAAVALVGCGRAYKSSTLAEERGREQIASKAQAEAAPNASSERTLAYEHFLSLDAEESKIQPLYELAQATCREAAADSCVVLASRINTGRAAEASLKFRASPGGIQKLVKALSAQGAVVDQSTMAEDLAAPLQDGAKKLAMLNDYRDKLEALRARAANDMDALIKLNHELAQVQSELEAAAGRQAHLRQRVDTEVLSVSIQSAQNAAFWRPVSKSLAEFGRNLSEGISSVVTGMAYLLPWALVLSGLAWVVRKLWRRRQRG